MDDEKREICEGCRTGNFWMCKSFPGSAKEHIKREEEFRKRKAAKRKERKLDQRPPQQTRVFRRDVVE